jgi:hypothetical protein
VILLLLFRRFGITLTKAELQGALLDAGFVIRGRHFLAAFALSLSAACDKGPPDAIIGPPPPTPHLSIEVRYVGPITEVQKAVVAAAVERWTRALSKNLGEFRFDRPADECFRGQPQLNESHHNPLVFVSVGDIDGRERSLAGTQVCAISSRDTLPVLTHIRLDIADLDAMESRGILLGVITHELGHALGFNPSTYGPKKLTGGGSDDPYFNGPTARAEFAKHGAWYTGLIVPLENQSGSGPNDPHWRLAVFGDEVMASGIASGFTSPLSVITLGLFQDLGYVVDFSVADPYEVRPLFVPNLLVPEFSLRNDLAQLSAPVMLAPVISR